MAQIPKGRLGKGPYKPICRDCAIYFSTTVSVQPFGALGGFLEAATSKLQWLERNMTPSQPGRGMT